MVDYNIQFLNDIRETPALWHYSLCPIVKKCHSSLFDSAERVESCIRASHSWFYHKTTHFFVGMAVFAQVSVNIGMTDDFRKKKKSAKVGHAFASYPHWSKRKKKNTTESFSLKIERKSRSKLGWPAQMMWGRGCIEIVGDKGRQGPIQPEPAHESQHPRVPRFPGNTVRMFREPRSSTTVFRILSFECVALS